MRARAARGRYSGENEAMEYTIVYKGRNWPSDRDGPNVALTVTRAGEYFQFYIAVFPPTQAMDLIANAGPHPRDVGNRWYQALTAAAIDAIERDVRDGFQPDADASKRINARFLQPDPAQVRALERGSQLLPEIRDGFFAGHEVSRFEA
jgi:hypothetical protein